MQTMSTIGSKLLLNRINSGQLSTFLEENGLYSYKNKSVEEKLDYLFTEVAEDNDLEIEVERFLCEQAKYNINRIIVTVPIEITSRSPLSNENAFDRSFPEYTDYNNIMTISDETLNEKFEDDENEYIKVFEYKKAESEQIECISKAFVKKKVRITQPDEDRADLIHSPMLDFIWVDIFPKKNYYRIHLAETLPSTKGQLSFEQNFDFFSKLIENEYNLIPIEHSAGHVFYKIYKELTEVAESPYIQKVADLNNKINSFVDDISDDIDYSDDSIDSIKLNVRMKKLLERAIIQQDFKNYIETTANREGFVDKFQYQDPTGGRVLASSNDPTFDMSKHDIYFDTKETIDINRILNTLWVRWFKKEEIDGKINTNQIKIKYDFHTKYYITHFLYSQVSKEECEYVLPKFDEYEQKSLD